jgi:hypothetical protein
MMELKEGFTIIKQSIAFHSPMRREIPNFYFGAPLETPLAARATTDAPMELRLPSCCKFSSFQ